MAEDYSPAEDLTPSKPPRAIGDITTRRVILCPRCKAIVDLPPIAWPVRPATKALVPKSPGPFPSDKPEDETRRMS